MKLDMTIQNTMYHLFDKLYDSKFMEYFNKFKTEILQTIYNNLSGQVTTANQFLKDINTYPADTLNRLEAILGDSSDMKVVLMNLDPIDYELFIIELRDKEVRDGFKGDAAFVRVEHDVLNEDGESHKMCSGFIVIDKLNPVINGDSEKFIISHEIVHAVMDFMVYKGLLPKDFDYNIESARESLEFLADFIPIYNKHYNTESEYISINEFIDHIQAKFKEDVQEKYKPFIKGLILFFNNAHY